MTTPDIGPASGSSGSATGRPVTGRSGTGGSRTGSPRRGPRCTVLACGLAAITLHAGAALASPTDVLRDAFADVNRILTDAASGDDRMERVEPILPIVERVFAFPDAARAALGGDWRARTPVEQEEFTRLFAALLERSFVFAVASRARVTGGVAVRFLDESIAGDAATVRTSIAGRDGNEIPVEYRMIARDGRWVIHDVVIEHVSAIGNYRAQFSRILRASSYPALLERMRERTAAVASLTARSGQDRSPRVAGLVENAPRHPGSVESPGPASLNVEDRRGEIDAPTAEHVHRDPPPEATGPALLAEAMAGDPAVQPGDAIGRLPVDRGASALVQSIGRAHAESVMGSPDDRASVPEKLSATASTRAAKPLALRYWVQVGAFKNAGAADRLVARLRGLQFQARVAPPDATGHHDDLARVRVGPFPDRAKAASMLRALERQGFRPFLATEPQ